MISSIYIVYQPSEIRKELTKILAEVTIEVNRLAIEKNNADRQVVRNKPKVKIISLSETKKQAGRILWLPPGMNLNQISGQIFFKRPEVQMMRTKTRLTLVLVGWMVLFPLK